MKACGHKSTRALAGSGPIHQQSHLKAPLRRWSRLWRVSVAISHPGNIHLAWCEQRCVLCGLSDRLEREQGPEHREHAINQYTSWVCVTGPLSFHSIRRKGSNQYIFFLKLIDTVLLTVGHMTSCIWTLSQRDLHNILASYVSAFRYKLTFDMKASVKHTVR